jgi:hypothetical protein
MQASARDTCPRIGDYVSLEMRGILPGRFVFDAKNAMDIQ